MYTNEILIISIIYFVVSIIKYIIVYKKQVFVEILLKKYRTHHKMLINIVFLVFSFLTNILNFHGGKNSIKTTIIIIMIVIDLLYDYYRKNYITEYGIIHNDTFISWESIENYKWSNSWNDNFYILYIEKKHKIFKYAIPIHVDQREGVIKILKSKGISK